MFDPARTETSRDSAPALPAWDRRALLAGLGGLAAGAFVASRAGAGPLDPPDGPVAPTGKPLADLEPRTAISDEHTPGDRDSVYRITQPGSYYLTGPVAGQSGKHGIKIEADDVTLDLMGFAVRGVRGSLDGIATGGQARTRISIRNGIITGFDGDGIDVVEGGAPTHSALIEGIHAAANGGHGLSVWDGAVIARCTASHNALRGISANANCVVSACSALQNGAHGIFCFENCSIVESTGRLNGTGGIGASFGGVVLTCSASHNSENGIDIGQGCVVSGCAASSNTLHGISAVSGNLLRANTCDRNGSGDAGAGIYLYGSANRVEDNNCTRADRGIQAISNNGRNIILRNTCSQNTVNWDIVAGNSVAPIVVAGVNAGSIVGDAFAGSLGTTDPHANFTY